MNEFKGFKCRECDCNNDINNTHCLRCGLANPKLMNAGSELEKLKELNEKLKECLGHAHFLFSKGRSASHYPTKEWNEERELFFKEVKKLE